MTNKPILNLLSVSFALLALQTPITRGDEVADKMADLKKLREKIPALHMVATSVSRSATGTRELKIETWEKEADGKRKVRRVITPKADPGIPKDQSAAPSLMVKDGDTAWREMDTGGKKLVFKAKADNRNEYTDVESLLRDGIAKFSSADKLLDHPCVLLEIREKANPDEIKASFWISERTGLVLKSVVNSPGATVTETKVTTLKLDGEVPNSLFTYRPPQDAQVIENK